MSIVIISFISSFLSLSVVDTSAHIQGQVLKASSGEKVFFATISLYKANELITEVTSDLDGLFNLGPLSPGQYSLEVHYLGMEKHIVNGLVLQPGVTLPLQIVMKEKQVLNELIDLATDAGVQGLSKLVRKIFRKKAKR